MENQNVVSQKKLSPFSISEKDEQDKCSKKPSSEKSDKVSQPSPSDSTFKGIKKSKKRNGIGRKGYRKVGVISSELQSHQ